jgi:mycoredoxin
LPAVGWGDVTDTDGELIVYTTVTCGQCWALKHWLTRERIPFREIGIENDADARRFVRGASGGYSSVPTVVLPSGRILVEPSFPQVKAALRG